MCDDKLFLELVFQLLGVVGNGHFRFKYNFRIIQCGAGLKVLHLEML